MSGDTEHTIASLAARGAVAEAPAGKHGEAAAYLLALHPAFMHREYALGTDQVVIGRDAGACDLVCSGQTISRRHLLVYAKDGGYALRDLNSTNGVFVNHQRMSGEAALNEGDLIGLGSDSIVHLRFQHQSGRNRPWTMELPPKDTWTIGRAPGCDIPLPFESTVSTKHATVRLRNGQPELLDAGSLNGTWLNGGRMRRAVVSPTDSVMIGSTLLRFEPAGQGLRVIRRDCGDEIALECVGLTREINAWRGASKRILERISLAIRPGEFVGLLGPSGAGKSTLLKALNGYNPADYGCVLLNEMPLYPCFDMFRNSIGYVPQDDIVHSELTVEDSLDYVARLRLPPDVDKPQRRELIDSTIETLGLHHVRQSRIQDLSGGQRKRVSIGCELITKPSLLFLDEPTSGMDPSTEERLMRHFQGMARRGTTVLITTHILYNLGLLDRVVILSRGRLVFFGTPAEAQSFFTIGGKPVERPTQIFEVLEGEHDVPPGEGDPKELVADAHQRKYVESPLFKQHVGAEASAVAEELLALSDQPGASTAPRAAAKSEREQYRTLLEKPTAGGKRRSGMGFFSWRGFATLTRRNFAIKLVSPKRIALYLAIPLVLALVTLSLRTEPLPDDTEMAQKRAGIAGQIHGGYVDMSVPIKALLSPQGADDPRPAEDIVYALKHEGVPNLPVPTSVLLMFVMTAVFSGTLLACLDLSTERPIYIRERMANQRIADYLGSKLPFLLAATAVQCVVFLALCLVNPDLRSINLPMALLALVALAWTSCALGLFLSSVDPTRGQFSVLLAIVAVLPQLVLSGGLGPDYYAGMPAVLKGIANALPARWGLEMLMTACYRHPTREALEWVPAFVRDTVGFGFGPGVYLKGAAVLLAQGAAWLLLCAAALRRLDRVK